MIKINRIKSYKIIDGLLLYINLDGELIANNNLIASKCDSSNYSYYNQKFIYLKDEETFIEKTKIHKTILIETIKEEKAIFSSELDLNTFSLKYQLVNLNTNKVIIDLGFFQPLVSAIIYGENVILVEKKVINIYSDNSIKTIHTNGEIIKLFGIYKSKLFFASKDYSVISADLDSKEIVHKWSEINNFEFDSEIQNKIPRAESFVFDGDKLIGALNTYYFEIDLITSEISAINISQELEKYNIFHIKVVNENPVTDKYIYLTAMMRQKEGDTKFSYDCLIALNKKTLEIDWHYAFEDAALGTNIPKLGGNKLYQLDNNNTLHIFEKIQNKLP